jgi:pectin methylesterase-like acyl-CoA thioesterase
MFYTKGQRQKIFLKPIELTMKNFDGKFYFFLSFVWLAVTSADPQTNPVIMFPADNAKNINPDTHLELTFRSTPVLGNSGKIKVYDASNDSLVDMLDLSIPSGPTKSTPSPDAIYTPIPYKYVPGHFTNANTKPGTPSGEAIPTPDNYQLTIIGGFTDGFHFYPVIIHINTATIYPHNNLLEYNKTYYVQIDPEVLKVNDDSFKGISGKDGWVFTTKANPPSHEVSQIVVNADGSGDFNTVQGAMDFIPEFNKKHVTVFIKNGDYEEIVYFRNKSNVTILGEDRNKVIIHYANNEVFNPHPINIKTNEWPGTFPSRRAAFMIDNSSKINLVNLTVKTTAYGQAEGLLINGEEIIVCDVTMVGSGDALQSNGTVYYSNCLIDGLGDTILGRGPAFFYNCEFKSIGPFMWIRNTSSNHGNVFVNCKFDTQNGKETVIARAPTNNGINYPHCEAVLINCKLSGISAEGWGPVGGETSNIHYWEYNSTNISNGKPVDVSKRLPASRQLTMEKDAKIIADYQEPPFVLDGWSPQMAPIILSQPESITSEAAKSAVFEVKTAVVPYAEYQWFKNDMPIEGATESVFKIEKVKPENAGAYSVSIKNAAGKKESQKVILKVK